MTKSSEADTPSHEEFEAMLTIAHYYAARSACLGQQNLVSLYKTFSPTSVKPHKW